MVLVLLHFIDVLTQMENEMACTDVLMHTDEIWLIDEKKTIEIR